MDRAPYFQTNNPASTKSSPVTRIASDKDSSISSDFSCTKSAVFIKRYSFSSPTDGIYNATPGFNGICHVNMLCISYGDYTICGMFCFFGYKKGCVSVGNFMFFSMEFGCAPFSDGGRIFVWNPPQVCLCSMRSVQILHLIIAKRSALKILYAQTNPSGSNHDTQKCPGCHIKSAG